MRLHALRGDRASALRVYHICVTLLERELGVEPSPATRALYEHLLCREAPLVETSPVPASKHNLPIPLSSFIGRTHEGRTHELAEVKRQLANTHLLSLTGAGGCGRTRLAVAAATEDALLLPTVAMVLGIREQPHRGALYRLYTIR